MLKVCCGSVGALHHASSTTPGLRRQHQITTSEVQGVKVCWMAEQLQKAQGLLANPSWVITPLQQHHIKCSFDSKHTGCNL
jgi:hypothetical protein